MSKVRWGVLSTADIGMSQVTPAIQSATNCDVVAIASRDGDRAAAAAAQLSIPDTYGTYEDLLAAENVDAVYIPLPNDMHAEWVTKAALAGKHILCEKPLAMSAQQAEGMVSACNEAGVRLQEAFIYRHHASWVEAVKLVRDGAIGELRAVQIWFSYYNDDPENIRNRVVNGGGAVMDIGCYNINLSRMLFDAEPVNVSSVVRRDPAMGIDILTSAILEFPDGGQSSFTCSIDLRRFSGYGSSAQRAGSKSRSLSTSRPNARRVYISTSVAGSARGRREKPSRSPRRTSTRSRRNCSPIRFSAAPRWRSSPMMQWRTWL